MCLFPLQINNPSKILSSFGGEVTKLSVPCNHCSQCKTLKRQEWSFRTYQECINVFRNGGFVYFDTLTYSDDFIPRFSDVVDIERFGLTDFTTFDLGHFKQFLKQLRRQLSYHYKITSSAFKYFLSSEYGLDDRYTHRPHYHILFFVYGKINAFSFSKLVAKCWKYGRTDGLPYKTLMYVNEHIYRNSKNDDYATISRVCGYVSKYITKDLDYDNLLRPRYNALSKLTDDKDALKQLFRSIDLFHRQSKGFGLSFLQTLTDEDKHNIHNGFITMRDSKKVRLSLSLPNYYKRHLYQYSVKLPDKTYQYRYKNDADTRTYLYNQLRKQVEKVNKSLYNQYLNLDSNAQNYIDKLLRGRTLYDLSSYMCYYRYRVIPFAYTNLKQYNNTCYDIYNQLHSIVNAHYKYNEANPIENLDTHYSVTINDLFYIKHKDYVHKEKFYRTHVYTEHTLPHFSDFDKIIFFLEKVKKINNQKVDDAFNHKEYLTKKHKKYKYEK